MKEEKEVKMTIKKKNNRFCIYDDRDGSIKKWFEFEDGRVTEYDNEYTDIPDTSTLRLVAETPEHIKEQIEILKVILEMLKVGPKRYELVNKIIKIRHMKITNLAKKLLDKKTRDLIEVGYIDGNLELTEEGKEALLSILFMEKKEDLVKMAQDEIKNNK